jgi:hypothetical protein
MSYMNVIPEMKCQTEPLGRHDGALQGLSERGAERCETHFGLSATPSCR